MRRRRLQRRLLALPGYFADFDPNADAVFSDSGATTPSTVTGNVRNIKDWRWRNGVGYAFTNGAGTPPTWETFNPNQNGLKFANASAQLTGNASMLPYSNNKFGLTMIQVTTLPASGVGTKRGIFVSRNAGSSVRAGSNVVAGNIYQIQSRSLDADGAQTSGSVATYTGGTTVVRIDVFNYENGTQKTYIDGTEVISGTPTWGGTSTSATDSTEFFISGQSGSLYYIDGWFMRVIFLDSAIPAWMVGYYTTLLKIHYGL